MASEAPPLITSEYFKLINSLYSKYGQPDQGAAKVFPLHRSQWFIFIAIATYSFGDLNASWWTLPTPAGQPAV